MGITGSQVPKSQFSAKSQFETCAHSLTFTLNPIVTRRAALRCMHYDVCVARSWRRRPKILAHYYGGDITIRKSGELHMFHCVCKIPNLCSSPVQIRLARSRLTTFSLSPTSHPIISPPQLSPNPLFKLFKLFSLLLSSP